MFRNSHFLKITPTHPPHLFVSLVSLPHRKKKKHKNKTTPFPSLQSSNQKQVKTSKLTRNLHLQMWYMHLKIFIYFLKICVKICIDEKVCKNICNVVKNWKYMFEWVYQTGQNFQKSNVYMCKSEQPLRPHVCSSTIPRPKRSLPLPCL